MAYPQFSKKYLGSSLIHPDHFGKNKLKYPRLPHRAILCYSSFPLKIFKKQYRGRYRKIASLWGSKAYYTKEFCFVTMNGVGSPHATMMLEELIALGVTEIINLGVAGGLRGEGIFLCTKALRDEGTSHHYLPSQKYSFPNEALLNRFASFLTARKISFHKGASWTTDAPFRETREELKHYRKQGIFTVEMEAAALFAVAQVRNVQLVSLFVVSDLLHPRWRLRDRKNVQRDLTHITEAALSFFSAST